MISLQEFERQGKCEGCCFYCVVEKERKVCTFAWYDDDSSDWEMSKNCDEIEERVCN